MSEVLLKQSLLLTHGTVYGQIDPLAVLSLSPKSVNIDQWNNPDYDWRVGLFEIRTMADSDTGSMTNNAPVDLVHWSAAGSLALSPMVPWRTCMKVLRHI